MKKLCMAAVMFVSSTAWAVDADSIVGKWLTTDKDGNRDSVVEIVNDGGVYNGKVIWLRYDAYPEGDPKGMAGQPIVDRENPDEALRTRPIQGMTILKGLKYDDEEWTGGKIYAVREGKEYKAKVEMPDDNTLEVRGYIGTPFLGQTVEWTRSEVPPK